MKKTNPRAKGRLTKVGKAMGKALPKMVNRKPATTRKRVKVAKMSNAARAPLQNGLNPWSAATMANAQGLSPEGQVQSLLISALDLLQSASVDRGPETSDRAERTTALVQLALAQIAGQVEGPSMDARQSRAFAKLLREKRKLAELSQEALALRSGLCRGTIKNVEAGRTAPTRDTIVHLLAVPELGLQVRDLAGGGRPSWKLNSWLPAGFDPLRMSGDMVRILNAPAGSLEQSHLYLDHQSAEAWLALSNSEGYSASRREACPLDQLTGPIGKSVGTLGLDVIALGVGDGKSEVRLVRHILDARPSAPRMSLNLLDISNTLLAEAQRHATLVLGDRVEVVTSHANFHDLSRYSELHGSNRSPQRRGLFTLLGGTMANLDNEVRFFQDLAGCSSAGDLVVLDCHHVHAPASRPEEIRQADPALAKGMTPSYVDWLSGPIHRHCRGAVDIQLAWDLNTACPVPGSYELDCFASVRMRDGSLRRFLVCRGKRYEPNMLLECLDRLGWERLSLLRFGAGSAKTEVLALLRRK